MRWIMLIGLLLFGLGCEKTIHEANRDVPANQRASGS
jgi:hypothetical protein